VTSATPIPTSSGERADPDAGRRRPGAAWLRRLGLACVLLLLAIARFGAAAPEGEATGSGSSLAGQLLVAAPDMEDPRFAHTVILVVWDNAGGAFGIVINRPLEEQTIASLMAAIGEADETVRGSVLVYAGGPVEPRAGFILHSAEYHRPQTVAIDGAVAMTSSPEILRDIGHGQGPAKALVAFGYTGWAPGQLEAEIAQRQWFTAAADTKLLFDDDRDGLWDEAMSRRTRAL
jgi:putative transcriptional regulator